MQNVFTRTGFRLVTSPTISKWYRLYTSRTARGSLCAASKGRGQGLPDYKIARRPLEDMAAANSRFPYSDSFELGHDLKVDAATVIESLGSLMTEERIARIDSVISKRTFNALPILEHPYDLGNVAAVCRSAEGMGFGSVHVIRHPHGDSYKQSTRTSAGSDKWLDVQLFETTEQCLTQTKKLGYRIVVTHLRAGSIPISDVDWSQPTAVILGNELTGASDVALEMSDDAVYIPLDGFVESYNVSVAAAITFWEIRRQRIDALGKHGDLSEEERHILKALMFLRNKGMSKQYITHMLKRPPPDWQLHRNRGEWFDKEFEEIDGKQVVVDGRKRCDYWDGEVCWGEQLLFPGKKCRFHELHFPGLISINKGKLKHRCCVRGLDANDINGFLKKKREELASMGSVTLDCAIPRSTTRVSSFTSKNKTTTNDNSIGGDGSSNNSGSNDEEEKRSEVVVDKEPVGVGAGLS